MSESMWEITQTDGVSIVRFREGAVLDTLTIQRIGRELYALAEAPQARHVLLDFRQIRFLSSQALGVLLTLRRKVDTKGAQVALAGLRAELRRVFELTKLDKLFLFFASNEQALDHFAANAPGEPTTES